MIILLHYLPITETINSNKVTFRCTALLILAHNNDSHVLKNAIHTVTE